MKSNRVNRLTGGSSSRTRPWSDWGQIYTRLSGLIAASLAAMSEYFERGINWRDKAISRKSRLVEK